MPAERQFADTNVLVRFFTGEPPEMAERARRLIGKADRGEIVLVVIPVIVAETFFTLESFYEMNRREVARKLSAFIQSRGIDAFEREELVESLARCEKEGAHFADSFLASKAIAKQEPVASFDRDFDGFKGVRRIEP